MRRIGWQWLAVSSVVAGLMFAAPATKAETRPQYGGTLHVHMRAAPTSLDPATTGGAQLDSIGQRSLELLIFDTLVIEDEKTGAQPSLAASWKASAGNQRWEFRIRRGVKFSDGTPLTAELAANSLRVAEPAWTVSADGDSLAIETGTPDAELLAELALPRNAIVKRNTDNTLRGTGPFHIRDWQPGKRLSLAAEDECWRGRPFLDAIEIEMGKSFREQMSQLELANADLIEVAPEQAHRMSQPGRRVVISAPIELLALLFARVPASADEKLLRAALAWSIERTSIRSVLLQRAGQSAASILPNWMSGYEFVFSTEADLPRARQVRDQVHTIPTWTLGYDGTDPMTRLLAERIALNAKDAGLVLQPTTAMETDLRLVQIPMASPDGWLALARVSALAGIPETRTGSAEDLYRAEVALLASGRVIPLFHLPVSYASSDTVKNWDLRPDGSLNLANAWLETRKP